MAYAETQSMFCDSLLDGAARLKRYARNAAGEAIPDALIHAKIASAQPFAAWFERWVTARYPVTVGKLSSGQFFLQTS